MGKKVLVRVLRVVTIPQEKLEQVEETKEIEFAYGALSSNCI